MRLNQLFSCTDFVRVPFVALVAFVATVFSVHLGLQAQTVNNAAPQKPSAVAPTQKPGEKKEAKPYKLTSRVHLQKNSTRGYLILQVELPKGSHIYSLTQKGDLRPTKLTVVESKQFRMLGTFAPDRPAEITKVDPVFKQQVEKHKGKVQFFAPIEVAPGVALDKLKPEITFDGQVCTAANFCMPILGEKVKGQFAGYFERTASRNSGSTESSQQKNSNSRFR